jgi:dihydroneopterin aldolase
MIKVGLEGAEFFAYHGYYPEEQVIGTRFLVDIQVCFTAETELHTDNLSHTVNYEVLYHIIEAEMQQPRKLIETVAQAIISQVTNRFPFIKTADVTLKKLSPPFKEPVKQSVITISYQQ